MIERLQQRRGEEGFTLVELLVVIAILGILAGVVVFAVGGINDKGQGSACKIDTRTLRTAEEAFSTQNSSQYTDMAGLVPNFLAEGSTLHGIAADDTDVTRTGIQATSYTITVADEKCGAIGGTVGNCALTALPPPCTSPDKPNL